MPAAVYGGPLDGRVGGDGGEWDAAEEVQAELQSPAVHVIGQRLEAPAFGGRGMFFYHWQEAPEGVHGDLRVRAVAEAARLELIPLDIDDDVLPAEFRELFGRCNRHWFSRSPRWRCSPSSPSCSSPWAGRRPMPGAPGAGAPERLACRRRWRWRSGGREGFSCAWGGWICGSLARRRSGASAGSAGGKNRGRQTILALRQPSRYQAAWTPAKLSSR